MNVKDEMRHDTQKRIAKRSTFMFIVTCLISDVHFHKTGPKLTFKTYNYRKLGIIFPLAELS